MTTKTAKRDSDAAPAKQQPPLSPRHSHEQQQQQRPVYVLLPPNATVSQKRGWLSIGALAINASLTGLAGIGLYMWPDATMALYQSNPTMRMDELAVLQTRALAAALFTLAAVNFVMLGVRGSFAVVVGRRCCRQSIKRASLPVFAARSIDRRCFLCAFCSRVNSPTSPRRADAEASATVCYAMAYGYVFSSATHAMYLYADSGSLSLGAFLVGLPHVCDSIPAARLSAPALRCDAFAVVALLRALTLCSLQSVRCLVRRRRRTCASRRGDSAGRVGDVAIVVIFVIIVADELADIFAQQSQARLGVKSQTLVKFKNRFKSRACAARRCPARNGDRGTSFRGALVAARTPCAHC